MTVDKYNDDEYTSYFEDNDWTKPETDKLFELCQRLDTRFITVADRMENRTVEDVKARYYTIARKLLDVRGQFTDDELSTMPLYRFQYDKDYDIRRKQQLNSLHRRTPADEAEEAKLVAELKAVDETLKKDQKLRTRARKQAESALQNVEVADRNVTVTAARPMRENKRQRTAASSNKFTMKVKGVTDRRGLRGGDGADDTPEGRVQRKLQELGVDPWPLPVASITMAHSELVDDLNKLVELEHRLRSTAHTIGQGAGFTVNTRQ